MSQELEDVRTLLATIGEQMEARIRESLALQAIAEQAGIDWRYLLPALLSDPRIVETAHQQCTSIRASLDDRAMSAFLAELPDKLPPSDVQ